MLDTGFDNNGTGQGRGGTRACPGQKLKGESFILSKNKKGQNLPFSNIDYFIIIIFEF